MKVIATKTKLVAKYKFIKGQYYVRVCNDDMYRVYIDLDEYTELSKYEFHRIFKFVNTCSICHKITFNSIYYPNKKCIKCELNECKVDNI